MAEIVHMPKLSDTMTEGVVAAWHKNVGDKVKSGDILAEIETDKATMEFESFSDGTLLHIGVPQGQAAPVDSLLAIIGKEGEDITALLASAGAPAKKEAPKAAPASKVEAQEGTTGEEAPAAEAALAARKEPAKAAPAQGTGAPKPVPAFSASTAARAAEPPSSNGRVKASPLAKRLADEKGIDIARVRGTGDEGRVTRKDIENYNGGGEASGFIPQEERFTEVPVGQMRKTIARRLSESMFTAPHFYLTIEVDMGRAMAMRESVNKAIEPEKISFNDLVLKAAAHALMVHPKVNSSWLGDRIRYNEHVHVGVAVAVEEGLLVPVVRFANTKGLRRIGAEVRDFAKRAKDKKLQPQDWEGNTFTISNLGMFGIDEFTAIINPPDACILAVGSIVEKPVVKDGAIVPGHIMKLTLSCDHRVVDGATGAAFMGTLRSYLEEPVLFLGVGAI